MIKYKKIGDDSEDILDVVLNNREISMEEVREIMNPSIEQYNPMLMKDMNTGIESLENAIKNNLKIGIIPDTDFDGYSSASSLHNLITEELKYEDVTLIFHKKNPKGHGLDEDIIEYLKTSDIDYLIIPDAGSGKEDYDGIKKIKEVKDMKFLIIDHHDVEHPDILEGVILINPKRKDCKYPNKNLSGCAVAYKFIQAFADRNNIELGNKYTDLVAVSLVSDMMNMTELENRLLFNIGSNKNNITNPLIKELILNKKITGDKLSITDCGFAIAPLINSTIRVGSDEDKELLFKAFYQRVSVISNKRGGLGALESAQAESIRRMTNVKKRQDDSSKEAFRKIQNQVIDKGLSEEKVLTIDVSNIAGSSLTGLVANKIIREYKRPVLLYRDKKKDNDLVGGSARGYGIDSFKDVCGGTGLFNFCSGHENAFGFEVKRDKIELVRQTLSEELKDFKLENILEVDAAYNMVIDLEDIVKISDIQDLWCNQIKEPLFLVKNIEIDASNIMKIGNSTYVFKSGHMSFTKNFGSRVWIEEFTHQQMVDSKARYPFKSKNIICDVVCKFRTNKGYPYLEVVDTKSKIIQ